MCAWKPALLLLLAAVCSSGESVKYRYDEAGRLSRIEYGSGKVITYSYDKAGNLVKREVAEPAPPAANKGSGTPKAGTRKPAR